MLTINNIETVFRVRNRTVHAVRGVSLKVEKGESVAIVGESGSGKSVLALSVMGLISQPPGHVSGSINFLGEDLVACGAKHLRTIRGNRICMVFQDPLASFNPYLRIIDQLTEPLIVHRRMNKSEAVTRACSVLGETGITDTKKILNAFPHEFSGGMLQRAMVAMAIMMKPDLVIADEPTTALDVTVQAQLIQLMKKLISETDAAVIFITHNLALVNGFCDRVVVMYAGMVLETGPAEKVLFTPAHPYTHALLRSIPTLTSKDKKLCTIPGEPPDPALPVSGCPFIDRCEYAEAICRQGSVLLFPVADLHLTACVRRSQGDVLW